MELQGDGADFLEQSGFDEGMNVFIWQRLHFIGRVLGEDSFKAAINGLPFVLANDTCAQKPFRMGLAGAHIDLEKNSIDRKRSIQLFEDGILIFLKPSLPEFHIFRGKAGIAPLTEVPEDL